MPFKSEKQRRYLWANEPEIARDWTDTYGHRTRKKEGGKEEGIMVTAPKYWKSSSDHETAELAYITPEERDILIDIDLYGSLKGSPNRGPSGIMSLQGDLGGWSSTPERTGGGSGDHRTGGGGDYKQTDYYKTMTQPSGTPTGPGQTYRSDKVAQMATPEIAYGPTGQPRYIGSQYKSPGQTGGWLSRMLGGQNKYGYRKTYQPKDWRMEKTNRLDMPSHAYRFSDPRTGSVKPGYGRQILGGLAGLIRGVPPFLGTAWSALGNQWSGLEDKLSGWNERRENAPENLAQMFGWGKYGTDEDLATKIDRDLLINDPDRRIRSNRFSPQFNADSNINQPSISDELAAFLEQRNYNERSANRNDLNKFGDATYRYTGENPRTSDMFQEAKVTKQDLAKYTPRHQKDLIDAQDYQSALDAGTINPDMTEYEFEQMKKGAITEPGTYKRGTTGPIAI